ncbi:hypothetical protein [Marinifilum caeruleilacunae]|uniref:Uncharacterized protein n=1 Tax=Marinifilum caeruleilacunae TaxID=2499076 RepID=A0ABX1WXD3_9BACT|nr:hypothetical protein [Marinifilum caeruleilacunae]NOU60793.1 hypothetical protein [Marinifilum caeruleilacunae]
MLYSKIKSWISKIRVKKSVHYKNIKKGESLWIDGKEYVKVKLQFVDTLSPKSKNTDQLQFDTKQQNQMLEDLKSKLTVAENKNAAMQILNTNLHNEINRDKKRDQKHEKLLKRNKELIRKIDKQKSTLYRLTKSNRNLRNDLRKKTEAYENLKGKILSLPFFNKIEKDEDMRKRLNDKVNSLLLEINLLQDKIVQHEHLSKNLQEKINQAKPEDLENKLY